MLRKGSSAAVADKLSPNGKKTADEAGTPISLGNAKKMRITMLLVGVSALLLDPMDDVTLDALRGREKMTIDKDRSKEEIAGEKLYRGDHNELVIPSANLLAALNHAGKMIKLDARRGMASGDSSWIPAFLRFEGEYCPLMVDGHPAKRGGWTADQRRGVNQTTKGATAIVRPKFRQWELQVSVVFNPVAIPNITLTSAQVRTLFELAGRASGLGSFRPSCKGPFGQFEITEWTETSLD